MGYGSYGSQVRRHEKFVVGVKNDHGRVQTLIGNKPPLISGQNIEFFWSRTLCIHSLFPHVLLLRQRRSGHPSLIHYLCGCFQDFVTFLPTRPLTTWYLHLCPMYGGNNYKKVARVPVSVSPVFHLRHQRRRPWAGGQWRGPRWSEYSELRTPRCG